MRNHFVCICVHGPTFAHMQTTITTCYKRSETISACMRSIRNELNKKGIYKSEMLGIHRISSCKSVSRTTLALDIVQIARASSYINGFDSTIACEKSLLIKQYLYRRSQFFNSVNNKRVTFKSLPIREYSCFSCIETHFGTRIHRHSANMKDLQLTNAGEHAEIINTIKNGITTDR